MDAGKVGRRVTKLMEEKGMTPDELARRAQLEPSTVQSVTENEVYPSLGPLLKIARALGVRLGTFLDDQVSRDPLIIRKSERKGDLSMLRAKRRPVDARFFSLGRGKTDRHMEPFFVELPPESAFEPETDKKLSSHEGEEFIVIVSGTVEVIYGRETHVLEPGDSIYYNSIVPHHVGCAGEQTAEIYAVLYFPE
ncbi:MAG: helix-turn-helix domain-containing protein [Thermodesulfobacteriota bacterium]